MKTLFTLPGSIVSYRFTFVGLHQFIILGCCVAVHFFGGGVVAAMGYLLFVRLAWLPGPRQTARVAVVGTGASAIQIVPAIQARTAHLTLFQRTPAWVLPRMDRTIGPLERRLYRLLPATRVARRTLLWAIRELQTGAFTRHPNQLAFVEKLAKRHLYRAVKDPELRRVLTPDYRIGCKRILLSNDYYPALSRDGVDLVTSAIAEVRPHAVVDADGVEHEVDVVVLGTGFRVRVVHCFWTFDDLEELRSFLVDGFGAAGEALAATVHRPRLSYNIAVYHRTVGAPAA